MLRGWIAVAAVAVLIGLPAAAQESGGLDLMQGPQLPPVTGQPQSTYSAASVALNSAEPSPILTLDQDRLYLESAWGMRATALLEAEGRRVTAENERLMQLLSTEEAELTEQRATLPAAEFRRLAEDFDQRATRIRRERAQTVQDLQTWADADQVAFFRAARPVMAQVMQEYRAFAVLDFRSVLVSLDSIDITQQLIQRLDLVIGDGDGVVPLPAPIQSQDGP